MAEMADKVGDQVYAAKTTHKGELLPPPVGTSDWERFSRDSYCVDKTLILQDLIDSKSRVVLFTRPRRFGKTTMLEMIRAFYEGDASLFHDKKIWVAGEKYRKEQGTHPVIFLSFKDIKQTTAEEAFTRLAAVIGGEVGKFADCVKNGWGDEAKKRSLRTAKSATSSSSAWPSTRRTSLSARSCPRQARMELANDLVHVWPGIDGAWKFGGLGNYAILHTKGKWQRYRQHQQRFLVISRRTHKTSAGASSWRVTVR